MNRPITDAVRDQYAAVAASDLSGASAGVRAVAEAFGYTPEELASIPAQANMGLSCGNPTALAGLKPGEVVVDLGSGGGLDVFLAAQKVGPTGQAIGIDMTPAMIDRAREAARQGPGGRPFANVAFHLAPIDRIPLPDASVDCVISNCVINLAPDKPAVFREIARILKPGGRLAVSDIALKQPLPAELAQDVAAYAGCIAGAILLDDYRRQLRQAGFAHVEVIDSGRDLNAYAKVENQAACCSPPAAAAAPRAVPAASGCCGSSPQPAPPAASGCCGSAPRAGASSPRAAAATCCSPADNKAAPGLHERLAELLKRYNVNDYAASVKVFALKPRRA